MNWQGQLRKTAESVSPLIVLGVVADLISVGGFIVGILTRLPSWVLWIIGGIGLGGTGLLVGAWCRQKRAYKEIVNLLLSVPTECTKKLLVSEPSQVYSVLRKVIRKDQNWQLRASAVFQVGEIGYPLTSILIKAMANDPQSQVRAARAEALGKLRLSTAREFLEEAACRAKDPRTQLAAIRALGDWKSLESLPVLIEALKSLDAKVLQVNDFSSSDYELATAVADAIRSIEGNPAFYSLCEMRIHHPQIVVVVERTKQAMRFRAEEANA